MRRRRAGWVTDWIRNSRGATLVEILASLVIIVLAAAASGAFFTSQVGVIRGLTKGSACKTAVESQMAIFERASSVAIAMPWRTQNPTGGPLLVDVKGAFPPVGAGKASNALPFSDPWLDDSLRLNINTAAGKHPITSTQLLPGTPGNYILDTVHLQRGTMALITSLYNGVPGICNGPILMSSIPQKVPAFQPDPLLLKNFDSTIQIEPIDLKTGGLVACSTYYPRPQPVMIDGAGQMTGKHTAISPNQIIGFQPDFSTRSDIGFRVTIRGQYDEFSGATKNCGVTQDFQYPVDSRPQSPSVILNAIGKGLPAGSVEPPDAFGPSRIKKQDAQANADAKLILEIGFKNPSSPTDPGQPLDPGTVFMCRDRSEQLNPNYCPGKGKGGTLTVAGATMNGAPSAPANSPWVPCDQVTVCGIAPQTASSFFSQPAPNEA
ncbi:MAG TPA: type II secretion system protein, partial [Bdellovibrionales bacterium]|nr:type II secretion system protein [Bdellovibrionales bacterium]